MFNRGQIWTDCWPIERVYVVVNQILMANSSGPGIVMLEDQVARLHTWDGNWAEDFVSIFISRPNNKIFVAYIIYPMFLFRPSTLLNTLGFKFCN